MIYWDKTRKQLEPQVALFERMMFEQDRVPCKKKSRRCLKREGKKRPPGC